MRTHTFLLGLVLGSSLAPAIQRGSRTGQETAQESNQESNQEEDEALPSRRRPAPLTDLREQESARMEQELLGAWELIDVFDPFYVHDPRLYRGFLMFADGFCSVHYQAVVEGTGVLGLRVDDFVQSEIYRYRIDQMGMLQLASKMGFNNLNDFFQLQFVGNTIAKEYAVDLVEGQLELTSFDGRRLTLRQVKGGEFPLGAIQKLQRTQGGRFDDPLDRDRRPRNFLGEDR